MNGDGKLDLVFAGTQSVSVVLGNGDGTFRPPSGFSIFEGLGGWTRLGINDIFIDDFNGDGKLDIVVDNIVMLGNGDGTFQPPQYFIAGPPGAHAVVSADLNGDRKPDLVFVDSDPTGNNATSLSIVLNNSPVIPPDAMLGYSAATGGSLLAPSIIGSIYGTNLARVTASATEATLPTHLGGISVRVHDSADVVRLAPLSYVSPTQINFVVPGAAVGPATLTIDDGSGSVVEGTNATIVSDIAPGFFTANGSGQGVPAASAVRIRADGTQEPVQVSHCSGPGQYNAVLIDLGSGSNFTGCPFGSPCAIQVNATGGGVTHQGTIYVQVTAPNGPNFTVTSNPSPVTMNSGSNSAATVSVNPTNGFNSQVTLAVTSVPTGGWTLSFPQPTINPGGTWSTNASVTAPSSASGHYTLAFSASVNNVVTQTGTINVNVTTTAGGFYLSVRSLETIMQGNCSSVAVAVTPNGSTPNVTLTASVAVPNSGITPAFGDCPTGAASTATVAGASGSAVLNFSATPSATLQTVPITVSGSGGGYTANATINLLVLAPPNGVTFANAPLASPSRVEVNLGPTQIDDYEQPNCWQYHSPGSVDSGGNDIGCNTKIQYRYLPSCSNQLTVRQCYQNALNFYGQSGVTGARFQFAFCGGADSTALVNCGQPPSAVNFDPSGAWRRRLGELLADIKASGIQNITPTPSLSGFGGDQGLLGYIDANHPPVYYTPTNAGSEFGGCSDQTVAVQWWPALPFPLQVLDPTKDNTAWPYMPNFNDSYNCAPANNRNFVGWSNLYTVIDYLIQAASNAGLNIEEFDVTNEVPLDFFTVLARLIVDNSNNNEEVVQHIAKTMYTYAFYDTPFNPSTDPTAPYPLDRVTFSVTDFGQTSDGSDCFSVYGDSARVLRLSNLVGALGGGLFGNALNAGTPVVDQSRMYLQCGGTIDGMIGLNKYYPPPTIVDMHTGHCLFSLGLGDCVPGQTEDDAATEMKPVFDGASRFMASFCPGSGWRGNSTQLCNALYMQGELPVFQLAPDPRDQNPKNCEGNPIAVPGGVVKGLNNSALAGRALPNGNPGVVFRPWLNLGLWNSSDGVITNQICYGLPQILKPALVPGH